MLKTTQAKHVPDDLLILAVGQIQTRIAGAVSLHHICESLPQFPPKVLLGKVRSLVKRGLLWAECTCGCAGKYQDPNHPASCIHIASGKISGPCGPLAHR